jgi:thiosulfate/3-mercaptopyruvate sulfurtransferase
MKRFKSIPLVIFSVFFALGIISCDAKIQTYPNSDLLIDAKSASELLYNEGIVFVDMRTNGFFEGHIPGAVWFGGVPALVDTTNSIADFLIPSSEFQSIMRMIGVNNDSKVIIYDDGNSLGSARLFFALELNGHNHIRIINGGIASWKSNELELSTSQVVPVAGNFTTNLDDSRTCDVRFIIEAMNNENVVILDARSPEEYSGESVRASKGGHIPNAVNIEWRNFVESDGIPYFRSFDEITSMLAEVGITPGKDVVTHCQTNVRGAHAYFTLRLMGYDSVRAYEGSWSEWGNREDTPISN